ncbi:MAG: DUF2460 domain-containing protein, partial [Xenococcus sp. (in: cyanobacteria)]
MSNYIDFVEERLDLGYDYGAVGGMRFKTTVINDGAKNEQKNVDWWLPLGRWQLGERSLLESDLEEIKELEYLRNFHQARKGSKQGFRFKDWSDYKANNVIAIADGQQTQWQLLKVYLLGDRATYRPITKPVEGSVKIYVNALAVTNWTIDYATGILTFDTAPNDQDIIAAEFEFDIPVWFEKDEFPYTLQGYQKSQALYQLGNLAVQEGRIPLTLPYSYLNPLPQKLSKELNLGNLLDILFKDKFDTSKESLASGYVRRDSNLEEAKSYLEISRNWNQEELDNLLNFFWNCKGKAVSFLLKINEEKYTAHFREDNLNIKFLASDSYTGESIYGISNLGFLALKNVPVPPVLPEFGLEEPIYLDFGLGFWEQTQEPPRTFTKYAGSSSASGDSRSQDSENDPSEGRGFGIGSVKVPLELPTGFVPKLIGEISGAPVILGAFNTTGSNLYLAVPNVPYNGTFILHDLGYDYIGIPELFLYRNNALHTILTVRPQGDTSGIRINACLEIFADLSFQITELTRSTQSSDSLSSKFYSSATTISFADNISPESVTGNQPRTIAVEYNFYNGGSSILNELRRSLPPYEKNRNNDPGNRYLEGAIYFDRIGRKIDEIQTDDTVVVSDFYALPNLLMDRMAGGIDAQGNLGFILTDFRLCDDVIEQNNLTSCPNGSLVPQVAFFEKLAGETELTWVGAIKELSSALSGITINRSVYHKRTLISSGYIINLPTGIFVPISEMSIGIPNYGLINAGQNYVVILISSGGGWKLYFVNFSIGR